MKLTGLFSLAALTAACTHAVAAPGPSAPDSTAPSSFEQILLDEHNIARTPLGIAPLTWSNELEAEAQDWANELARRGEMVHAGPDHRRGAGENLWAGAAGYYGPYDMVSLFVAEGQWYRHGRFPNISTTGNWRDVGHYTQVIWSGTREVGCAIARGSQEDFLVCRYYPAGNAFDQLAY